MILSRLRKLWKLSEMEENVPVSDEIIKTKSEILDEVLKNGIFVARTLKDPIRSITEEQS